MIIRPIYQTKHVNVEMTQNEVKALRGLYLVLSLVLHEKQKTKRTVWHSLLKKAFKAAPKIIDEPAQVKPK